MSDTPIASISIPYDINVNYRSACDEPEIFVGLWKLWKDALSALVRDSNPGIPNPKIE